MNSSAWRQYDFAKYGLLVVMLACKGETLTDVPAHRSTPLTKPASTWVSPQPCQFNSPANPSYPASYPHWNTLVSASRSTCNVSWSLYFAYNSIYGGMQGPEYAIEWTRDAGDPDGSGGTLFMIPGSFFTNGVGSGRQNGPLELRFASAVKNVSVVLSKDAANAGGLLLGHYMIALDSVGQQIGRIDFDAGVDVSEKTLAVGGIRKVLEYPVVVGHRDDYNIDIVEAVHRRVSFDVQPPGTLNCLNRLGGTTIARGDSVFCKVTGPGVSVTSWQFNGPSYDSAGTIDIRVTSTVNPWKGLAAASGTVTARITANGRPDSLKTTFTVNNRTGRAWHWEKDTLYWKFEEGKALQNCSATTFANYDTAIVGWNTRKGVCDGGVITPTPAPTKGYTLQQVSSGPNTGLYFVKTITYRMDTQSNFAAAVKSGSNIKWKSVDPDQQTACTSRGYSNTVNFFDFNSNCMDSGSVIAAFHQGLLWHEGYGRQNNSGHQAQLELSALLPENDLYKSLEAVFRLGKAKTDTSVTFEAKRITAKLISAAQDHTNVYDNWVPCGDFWKWDPPTKKWTYNPIIPGARCI